MKRMLTLAMAVFCIALYPVSAQKSEANENDKFYKAREIIDAKGDLSKAAELLHDNIMEYPKHIQSYVVLVSLERHFERYGEALRLLDQAIKNNHKGSGIPDVTLLWWKGTVYADMDEAAKGIEIMNHAVKLARKQKNPNLMDMLQLLAQLHYDLKQYDESDRIYNQMRDMDDTEQLPMIGLVRNMIAREKYDDALATLEECRKYDRDYSEIYRFQMQAYEGKMEYKKMIDAMMTLFEKSDDTDYIDVDKLMMDEKYSVALLKEKIAAESDNALWKVVLASVYQESYMYPEVISILDGLIEEYGYDEDLLEERGECYAEMGMIDLALEDINRAIDICDERNLAYYYARRGDIYRSAAMYDEAIEDFTKMVDRYPTDAYGYYARGWCKELSGDREGAMKDYDEGISVDEDYPYIFLMRGTLFLEDGNMDRAMADFEMVVAKDTTLSDGSCRHYALNFLGREEEAMDWMEDIINHDPDDPGNWYDKACLLARMGRCDEAVSALRTSFEKGYRRIPHIEHDNDMDPIRDRDDFKALLKEYKQLLDEEIQRTGKDVGKVQAKVVSEVDMKKMYGGTYEIPCSVNGLPLKMIFDTGASDVTISSVEANFMLKNGYLSENDIKGKTHYMTASGDIHEGTVLKLKEVKLGDAVLKNIEASVVHSQKAPLLLGQSVLEKFGTITIDNVNLKLLIKQ